MTTIGALARSSYPTAGCYIFGAVALDECAQTVAVSAPCVQGIEMLLMKRMHRHLDDNDFGTARLSFGDDFEFGLFQSVAGAGPVLAFRHERVGGPSFEHSEISCHA